MVCVDTMTVFTIDTVVVCVVFTADTVVVCVDIAVVCVDNMTVFTADIAVVSLDRISIIQWWK